MSTIIGIDLGTSTTEAAVIRDGRPVMIVNLEGDIITPSVVGIDDAGNLIVGERARAQYLLAPDRTAIEVKRKMGSQDLVFLGKRSYTPVEVSARLLEYVRTYVSEQLQEDVVRAVISVPAYFDEIQRRATVEAGTLAGFQVERILNEPTAAALSYGLEHLEEESHILVYDLGGGTFDVTLLEMFDGVLEVKASSGDNQLGGKDFDEKLIEYLAEEFQKKHGFDLRKDTYASVRLKEEAECCKKALSTEESCRVLVPMIAEKDGTPLELDVTVTQSLFEELTADLIERTHKPIDVVLSDAGILPEDIQKIILVGGSTRMPVVSRDIRNYLKLEPELAVNPDYAVAEGASIQAGIIEGTIREEESILMTDVNPYTLGVRCRNGFRDDYMSVVIPRNVTIPTKRDEIYYTSGDYQTKANIEVYQGESAIVTSNHFLGDFLIDGIPSRLQGEEKIRVEFSYNLNGMLEVRAIVVSTGKDASITIDMMDDNGQEEAERDVSSWKTAPGAKKFRTVIRRAERSMEQARKDGDEIREIRLKQHIYKLKLALVENDLELAKEREEILNALINEQG